MTWLIVIGLVTLFCFSFVLLFGAPYVPTLTPQVKTALELADLQPGQVLIELGSGDGKVLIAAAKAGLTVVGYELNPMLVGVSWLRTRRYGKQVSVVWGNFWSKTWPADTAAIFTFLHPNFMKRLDKKIVQYNFQNVKLVSFAFEIPNRTPLKKDNGVLLYEYRSTTAK
jgi:hypothetical protein